MIELTTEEYFAARASEARNMSETVTDPRAALAHAGMAVRYAQLAMEFHIPRAPQMLPGDFHAMAHDRS